MKNKLAEEERCSEPHKGGQKDKRQTQKKRTQGGDQTSISQRARVIVARSASNLPCLPVEATAADPPPIIHLDIVERGKMFPVPAARHNSAPLPRRDGPPPCSHHSHQSVF